MTTPDAAPSALAPSDADYLGHSHEQLVQFVTTNLDPRQVSEVAAAYTEVQKAFEDFATQLNAAVAKSAGAWEGDAAANAHAYFETLGKWADATAQNARLAATSVDEQAAAAQTARNSMPEPVPFDWTDEFKHWTEAGPFDLGDAVDKSLRKQHDSQSAHERAAQTMATYDQSLHAAAAQQPAFAGPPKFASAGGGSSSTVLPAASTDHHSATGASAGAAGASVSGGHDVPGASGTGSHGPSGPGQITGSGHVPDPNAATTSASVTPAAAHPQPGGANPSSAPGGMPMGGMPMGGGMGGFGADEEHQSKYGRAGTVGAGDGVSGDLGSGGGMGGVSGAPARMGMGGAARYEEDEDSSRFFTHVEEDSEYGDLRAARPVIGE